MSALTRLLFSLGLACAALLAATAAGLVPTTPAGRGLGVLVLACVVAAVAAAREGRAGHDAEEMDLETMLWAIRQVESGDNPRAIGPRGERSAYQFMPATWRAYTRAEFVTASTMGGAGLAHAVARKHAAALRRVLARSGLDREPVFFAAAWCYGPAQAARFARGDYAQRVMNLYWDRRATAEAKAKGGK